jgi:hypothetical protein
MRVIPWRRLLLENGVEMSVPFGNGEKATKMSALKDILLLWTFFYGP